MEFTLDDLVRYLKTNPTGIKLACRDAGVGLRYRVNPGGYGRDSLRLEPLTAQEAGDVIRAFRMRKALGKVRTGRPLSVR